MINSNLKKIVAMAMCLSLLFFYQQCDNVKFSTQTDNEEKSGGPDSVNIPGNDDSLETIDPVTYDQTRSIIEFNQNSEILFVLDDSCSMGSIIDNLQSGIDSISQVEFAPNTKMATTYMSPVKLANGLPNFLNPYYPEALHTPGHMQLVSKSSIDAFLSLPLESDQGNLKTAQKRFQLEGCEDKWFSPLQSHPEGHSCLKASMQSPNMCTIVEAGMTALDQLLYKKFQNNERLFRTRTNLNVVFVSDTHDAGYSPFYGTDNPTLPNSIPTMSEIRNRILQNNPNIQSLRFNGIVKLPPEGHPKLVGLNTIGTPYGANINSEKDYNFVYLDYIKETGGVAMHAETNDWSMAMKELVKFTNSPNSALVLLHKTAVSLDWVKVNGVEIDPSQYDLKADKTTVEVHYDFQNSGNYEITVRFKIE